MSPIRVHIQRVLDDSPSASPPPDGRTRSETDRQWGWGVGGWGATGTDVQARQTELQPCRRAASSETDKQCQCQKCHNRTVDRQQSGLNTDGQVGTFQSPDRANTKPDWRSDSCDTDTRCICPLTDRPFYFHLMPFVCRYMCI